MVLNVGHEKQHIDINATKMMSLRWMSDNRREEMIRK